MGHGEPKAALSLGLNVDAAAFILTLILRSVLPALAQTAAVSGRVLDQTGSVLPGVTIGLISQTTELTAACQQRSSPSSSIGRARRADLFGVGELNRSVHGVSSFFAAGAGAL